MIEIKRLILATGSVYRQKIWQFAGIEFDCLTSDIDETKVTDTCAENLARKRALAKARAVGARLIEDSKSEIALIIGCDQTLSLNGKIYSKAQSEEEARERLKELSGQTHYLHSAVVVTVEGGDKEARKQFPNAPVFNYCENIAMEMRTLSDLEIDNYLLTGEWKGCLGCYQAENYGMQLFDSMGEDLNAIIGLPIVPLTKFFRTIGINGLTQKTGPWAVDIPR